MRNLLLFLIIGLAAYGGYTYWESRHAAPKPVQGTEAGDAPALKPEPPAPTPEPPKPAAEKPAVALKPAAPLKRLAPEGVYYAIQAFSITTDAGVRGIRAGTAVRLIKDDGATLRVTDGQQEFDARREVLTNDLDIAARATGQQASQQAANAEWQQKQQAQATVNQRQNANEAAATQERVQQNKEAARAAAEQRAQRMAEIRSQIAAEENAKRYTPTGVTRQKY